jgi:hypothetical protein
MSDFRKLCAELAEDARYLLGCVDDGDIDPVCIAECREHLGRARAELAKPVGGPAAPSDEEIHGWVCQWWESYGKGYLPHSSDTQLVKDALNHFGTTPTPANRESPTAGELQTMATMFGLEVNDWAALSWLVVTCIAAYGDGATPTPPDDGELPEEVATLIPWLLEKAAQAANSDAPVTADMLTLAALLLGERGTTPTPIPVAERLPGERDCDAEGRCWLATTQQPDGWVLDYPEQATNWDHWLPFHALPLPAAPGEGA